MIFDVRAAGSLAKMAAVKCEAKDGSSSDLPRSAIPSGEAAKTIEQDESSHAPLHSSWTFWLNKAMSGITAEEYKTNIKKIYTVNTVHSFWGVFNNIPNVSDVQAKYSYHLMRDERQPIWEDPINQKGGTWRFKCHKYDTEKVWKEVVVAAIGEQFTKHIAEGDEVCGVTVSIKDKEDLIQIWNVDASLASKATVIEKVRSLVPEVNFLQEFYKPHQTHHAYGRR